MKRYISLFLACVMVLLLCACAPGGTDTDTGDGGSMFSAEPTPTPTPEVTPSPTPTPKPVYTNPLNGTILEQPYTGRIFAASICNTPNAVPHISLNEADIVLEMFVNNSIIRNLALYSNIQDVEVFGSVRSTRLMFHQLVSMYDAVLIHSGGASQPLEDISRRGLDNFNIDMWRVKNEGTSYRDTDHGRSYEATLFGLGEGCFNYAANQGMRTEQPADMDYGLTFADEGTPAEGETADLISCTFKYNGSSKLTEMKYDAALDKYVYWQYEQEMRDLFTNDPEAFTNVIIMRTKISMNGIYQVADYTAGGDGWYACGGKLIPITWSSEGGTAPLKFAKADGTPLNLERGNTYIAIAPVEKSEIYWQ